MSELVHLCVFVLYTRINLPLLSEIGRTQWMMICPLQDSTCNGQHYAQENGGTSTSPTGP